MKSLSIQVPGGFVSLFCTRTTSGAVMFLPESRHGLVGGVALTWPVSWICRFAITGPLVSGPGLQVWPLWAAVIVANDAASKGGLQ